MRNNDGEIVAELVSNGQPHVYDTTYALLPIPSKWRKRPTSYKAYKEL